MEMSNVSLHSITYYIYIMLMNYISIHNIINYMIALVFQIPAQVCSFKGRKMWGPSNLSSSPLVFGSRSREGVFFPK